MIARSWSAARGRWSALTIYQKFEHGVLTILTLLIAVVIVSAVWNLILRIFFSLVLLNVFDPTDHAVFQAVFGMIFTASSRSSSGARCCWWPTAAWESCKCGR